MGSNGSSKNPTAVDGNHRNPKNSSLVTPSKSRKKQKHSAPVSNDSNVLYPTPSTHSETDSQNSNCRGKATVGVKEQGRVEKKVNARDKREKVSKKPKGEKKKVDDGKEDTKKKETKKENYVEDRSIPEKNKMGQEIEEIFRANKKRRKEFPGVVGQSSTIAKVATGKEDKLNKRKTVKEKKEKKIGFPVHENSDNRFKRRRTTDGFAIYSEEELGMGNPDAGNTPLCPFDCSCCF